jgi:peptidoglycan hydrolase-like protein with peptidoglycan-binding domain
VDWCAKISDQDQRMVIWQKPPSGDHMAPYDDPLAHMDLIRFHSDWRYLKIADETDVTVNHAQVNGVSGTGYAPPSAASGSTGAIANGQIVTTTHNLFTHGLPYTPKFFVLIDDVIVTQGTVVQLTSDRKKVRFISPYVTSTQVRLKEIGISNTDALPALSQDYRVIVLKDPIADPAAPLTWLRADGNPIILGHGKITSEDRTLRRTGFLGDEVLKLPDGQTADIRNGALRTILNGQTREFGQYIGSFFQADTIDVTF